MSEETLDTRPQGLSLAAIRTVAAVLLAVGVVGAALLEKEILGQQSGEGLLTLLEQSPDLMGAVTAAVVCRAVYSCAVPLYAFLLVEGFSHTRDFRRYLLRVLLLALACEIPYNLATTGGVLALSGRNPVFGVLLALVMLYLYGYLPKRYTLLCGAAVTFAAILWAALLGIDQGEELILLTAVLWFLRDRPRYRGLIGCLAAFACCLFSPYYVVAPMSLLLVHLYSGEKGAQNPALNYLLYPVLLLALAVAGSVL